jgi:predicted dehydrogenase
LGGSRKMVVYDDVEPSEKVRVYDRGVSYVPPLEEVTTLSPIYRSGDVLIPELERTEALRLMAQHFLHCIRTKREPITGGRAGLDVVRILAAAQASLDRGGAWVEIEESAALRPLAGSASLSLLDRPA